MTKKIYIPTFIGIILACLVLLFSPQIIPVNNGGIAKADDTETPVTDKPINCKRQMELNLNIPIVGPFSIEFSPNQLEMPIGQSVDRTEDLAQRIIDYMQRIIDAAGVEIDAAQQMLVLAKQCGKPPLYTCSGVCTPEPYYGCCPITNPLCNLCPDSCREDPCSGPACPPGIPALQQTIEGQVAIIQDYKHRITMIFQKKIFSPIGAWWCSCPITDEAIPGYGFCFPPPGRCRSETQLVLDKLEKARSGDFQVWRLLSCPPVICESRPDGCFCGPFGIIPVTSIVCPEPYEAGPNSTCWYRLPPGLKDCVLRPTDLEEGAAGQKQISLPSSCRDAVSSGILGQSTDTPESIAKTCWGNTRCILEKEAGRTPPAEWYCSGNESETEDYFCCE